MVACLTLRCPSSTDPSTRHSSLDRYRKLFTSSFMTGRLSRIVCNRSRQLKAYDSLNLTLRSLRHNLIVQRLLSQAADQTRRSPNTRNKLTSSCSCSPASAGRLACACQSLSLGYCSGNTLTGLLLALQTTAAAKLAPGRELPTGQAAMQPVENRWTKKRKAEEEAAIVPPANVVMQFQSDDGVKAGASHAQGYL